MAELEGVYIIGYGGGQIKVTDIDAALSQARMCVRMHETNMKAYEKDSEIIIFPEAQKEWVHTLKELEKIEIKVRGMQKKQEKKLQEFKEKEKDNDFSESVTQAREKFGSEGTPGFIRNDRTSPLYGYESNYLFMSPNSRIKLHLLEIGESTKNSSGTKITRIR